MYLSQLAVWETKCGNDLQLIIREGHESPPYTLTTSGRVKMLSFTHEKVLTSDYFL